MIAYCWDGSALTTFGAKARANLQHIWLFVQFQRGFTKVGYLFPNQIKLVTLAEHKKRWLTNHFFVVLTILGVFLADEVGVWMPLEIVRDVHFSDP